MKFIVSFTTSPIRIHKCKQMLDSILRQSKKPDLIILNIPKIFERTGKPYSIPNFIKDTCVINVVETDYGPATKIVPTIEYLNKNGFDKNNTRIIYLDDDIRYCNQMVETYNNIIEPGDNSVWTSTGFNYVNLKLVGSRKHLDSATIAEGYGAVCVKLSIFEDDFTEYINKYTSNTLKDCKFSDDIILSNYYHKKKIKIIICCVRGKYSIFDLWHNKCILDYGNKEDALHLGANNTSDNNSNRYRKVIKILNENNERYFKLQFIQNNSIKYL
jgi:hypothetical protein